MTVITKLVQCIFSKTTLLPKLGLKLELTLNWNKNIPPTTSATANHETNDGTVAPTLSPAAISILPSFMLFFFFPPLLSYHRSARSRRVCMRLWSGSSIIRSPSSPFPLRWSPSRERSMRAWSLIRAPRARWLHTRWERWGTERFGDIGEVYVCDRERERRRGVQNR